MMNMTPKEDSSDSNENFFIDMEPPITSQSIAMGSGLNMTRDQRQVAID
jgi:hypothetical protein